MKENLEAGQNLLATQYQQQLTNAKQKVLENNRADYIEYESSKEEKKRHYPRQNGKRKRGGQSSTISVKNPGQNNGSHIDITI